MSILVVTCLGALESCFDSPKPIVRNPRWTEEHAKDWGKKTGWLRGSNFNPSTAINQLETWQAESFDTVTIDRELGWAEGLGLNVMRVYLHHLAWEVDQAGFKKRLNTYLSFLMTVGIPPIRLVNSLIRNLVSTIQVGYEIQEICYLTIRPLLSL